LCTYYDINDEVVLSISSVSGSLDPWIPELRHYAHALGVPIILIGTKLGKHLTLPFIQWIGIAIIEWVVLFF